MSSSEDFAQLRLKFTDPIQHEYEVIRPIVLFSEVSQPTFFQSPFKSPQLVLLELDDEQWLKIRQRTYYLQQKRFARLGQQLPLRPLDVAI